LSILDKIVSFTNGDVNYQHTLEHLNILDAEYYFKLMDSMQQQDLAGAMLLYDDIDKKGFEGDLVLNGFAEFIRNLLVCKDPRAAELLEVVESFKEKYLSTAKKVNTGYLVSALNVLNDADINYKTARNKRLHVELVLIKLCYLGQAIELAAADETINKKKVTDNVSVVAFRQVPIIHSPSSKNIKSEVPDEKTLIKAINEESQAKLIIEKEIALSKPGENIASLIPESHIETQTAFSASVVKTESENNPLPKSGMLENIRQQFEKKQNGNTGEQLIPLTEEKLQTAWMEYTGILKDSRNSAAQSFELARLKIVSDHSFEVITNNNLEHRFIEQEKRRLCEFFQQVFMNKALRITIVINETVAAEPAENGLNKRQQLHKLVEEYPLVKELKDRLRLELDY